ncbi:MAG: tRNA (N6-isopentenyl adenosine(37)-C2)-methylthiotransferase MiaB, partial [Candidatus Omnitrophica bacterium]|nr:tRNA (N6-isopentenyl adenosine(37)-C2)-methylthiotransferase MiaB [Candidatus Omnitrophota bacterium]MCF7894738.1 tRNA (N6-isopentenyl adenosine(37)-C2)-methylthiotransferase MiaB [Candidatus Omnitrophota bacterium]
IGFPTETESDFKKTKQLIKKGRFKYAYIFKYSPRPGTKAAKLKDDVPEDVKKRRHKELLDLQKKISKTV